MMITNLDLSWSTACGNVLINPWDPICENVSTSMSKKSRASYCLYASLLELHKKMLKDADFAVGWMKSCQNQIWLKSTPLDRWRRQCSVICSEKSDRRELITREMIYSRIFIPCHSHQICAINELCGDRSIAKNLPKILTNSRLCLLQCCL